MKEKDLSTPVRLATVLAFAFSGCTKSMSTPDYDATTDSMRATLNAMETHLAEMKTAASTQVPTATLEKIATQENVQVSDWDVEIYDGATKQMIDWVEGLKNLDPEKWLNFPNIDNPQLEWG